MEEPETEIEAAPQLVVVEPKTKAKVTRKTTRKTRNDGVKDGPPVIGECICCHRKADFVLVRVSACLCHSSIRYSICRKCRDTKESERLIEDEMREQFLRGGKDAPEVARQMSEDWWRQQQLQNDEFR